MPVSFGNNRAIVNWDQWCQSHLGTIVPVSLGENLASLTWEHSRKIANSNDTNIDNNNVNIILRLIITIMIISSNDNIINNNINIIMIILL